MTLKCELGRIELRRLGIAHRKKLERHDVDNARSLARNYFHSHQRDVTVSREGSTLVVHGDPRSAPANHEWQELKALFRRHLYEVEVYQTGQYQ